LRPKNKVLKQSPKPGTDAGPGGEVKLTVAR
jgi:beta-lactam-binding protein with PASTA domain